MRNYSSVEDGFFSSEEENEALYESTCSEGQQNHKLVCPGLLKTYRSTMDPCFQLCIYKQTIQPKITKTSCHHLFGNGREDKYPEENQAYSPDGRTCSRGHISDVQLHQQKSPNTQAYNIPDLHDMVRASFTPKPDAGHMESLLDFGRKDIIGE